jgi:lipoprotein-anchoring transpeptidase ErfK/SrfK
MAQAPPDERVLTAQVLLDRSGFSPGEIDGRAGINLQRALSAFQQANGLPVSGKLDDATLEKLRTATSGAPAMVAYALTAEDVNGPFTPDIPSDLVEQGKLKQLEYRDPLERVAERFHASPAVLRHFNPQATFMTAGEKLRVPNVVVVDMPVRQRPEPKSGRRQPPTPDAGLAEPSVTIYVTAATSALTVEDQNGSVLFFAPVTSGSEHDPLPIGRWTITTVEPLPAFNYNPDLFWDADPKHAKSRIAPGPNNPVGTVWIDLSKEHYGIHGTPEPSKIGYTQSHGCVRLTNWDVQRLAKWARPGTTVVFR